VDVEVAVDVMVLLLRCRSRLDTEERVRVVLRCWNWECMIECEKIENKNPEIEKVKEENDKNNGDESIDIDGISTQ
jgi:hypothetical protein